jgi:tetratricopeptide (TPR) repeat protein
MTEAFTPTIKRVAAPAISSESAVRKGKRLLKEKKFDEALELFEDLVRRDQADAFVHAALARIKFKQKDMDGALDHFRISIKMDPTKPQAYIRSARIYFARGQLSEAKEALENAIRVQPQAPVAYAGLGAIYEREKQPELAIRHYQKALQFNPRMALARKRLAECLSSVGRTDEAMGQIGAALRIKSDDPDTYAVKGRLHLREKQYNEALQSFERAVELDPDGKKLQIRIGLADAYIHAGKLALAERVLTQLPQREQSPLLHKLWGDLYTAQGMHREALEEYRAASVSVGEDLGIEALEDIDFLTEEGDDDKWGMLAAEAKAAAERFVEKRRQI